MILINEKAKGDPARPAYRTPIVVVNYFGLTEGSGDLSSAQKAAGVWRCDGGKRVGAEMIQRRTSAFLLQKVTRLNLFGCNSDQGRLTDESWMERTAVKVTRTTTNHKVCISVLPRRHHDASWVLPPVEPSVWQQHRKSFVPTNSQNICAQRPAKFQSVCCSSLHVLSVSLCSVCQTPCNGRVGCCTTAHLLSSCQICAKHKLWLFQSTGALKVACQDVHLLPLLVTSPRWGWLIWNMNVSDLHAELIKALRLK